MQKKNNRTKPNKTELYIWVGVLSSMCIISVFTYKIRKALHQRKCRSLLRLTWKNIISSMSVRRRRQSGSVRVHSTVRKWEDPYWLRDRRDATRPSCSSTEILIWFFILERNALLSTQNVQTRHFVLSEEYQLCLEPNSLHRESILKPRGADPFLLPHLNRTCQNIGTVCSICTVISRYVCMWSVGLCFQSILPSRGQSS